MTGKKTSWALFRRCLGYFRPYALHIALATVAMLVVAAVQPMVAYLVKPTLDEIFINKDKEIGRAHV